MGLKPIKKRRLFEEIIIAIEDYVKEENIKPGDRLPSESDLAKIFNVSKTSVREAMSVLHANGVIESHPGTGIYLRAVGENIAHSVTSNLIHNSDIQEILDFRRGIEVEAASLAALRANSQDIKMIKKAHKNLVQANSSGLVGVKEDYDFHCSIIQASHNSIYKDVFDSIADKFELVVKISKMQSAKLPGRFKESHSEHEKIIEAIESKNPNLAYEAMRNHLVRNEKKIWVNVEANEEKKLKLQ